MKLCSPPPAAGLSGGGAEQDASTRKTVVLTFDDAVKSHLTFVAPLLAELNFPATFFITQAWMADEQNFLTWAEVADIHGMGFEIGNHSWTHALFHLPGDGAKLVGELRQVEDALGRVGIPKPISFGWTSNHFGPEALQTLRDEGYRLARRGMQPETAYGKTAVGPMLDVSKHHPLLIPTAGDSYPAWTFEHFLEILASAGPGEIPVLQFHGVPDRVHPWVHTAPESFRRYMHHLRDAGYSVLCMRDLLRYYDEERLPQDPLLTTRYPPP